MRLNASRRCVGMSVLSCMDLSLGSRVSVSELCRYSCRGKLPLGPYFSVHARLSDLHGPRGRLIRRISATEKLVTFTGTLFVISVVQTLFVHDRSPAKEREEINRRAVRHVGLQPTATV